MRGSIQCIDSKQAIEFLLPRHYSGRKPQITKAFGWFDTGVLKAVCTFGKPASNPLCKGVCGEEFSSNVYELNIPFIAAIPCLRHDSKWIDKSRYEYGQILMNKLCTVHLVSNCEYNSSVMQRRNKWMVDNCDYLIAVWDGTSGGTANCVKYAESVKRNIFRIDPNNL